MTDGLVSFLKEMLKLKRLRIEHAVREAIAAYS